MRFRTQTRYRNLSKWSGTGFLKSALRSFRNDCFSQCSRLFGSSRFGAQGSPTGWNPRKQAAAVCHRCLCRCCKLKFERSDWLHLLNRLRAGATTVAADSVLRNCGPDFSPICTVLTAGSAACHRTSRQTQIMLKDLKFLLPRYGPNKYAFLGWMTQPPWSWASDSSSYF